jgi:hypothetical protein
MVLLCSDFLVSLVDVRLLEASTAEDSPVSTD